ncbi:hypothetical protein N9A28_03100 [Sulfurimonas sp.]|nr:hypothetical protein [Sulfurimonas sp.]
MSEGFDKLKDIGAQKIHESTHISKKYIEDMLQENFEDMNKIQFLGFLSILERDYNVDLIALKNKAIDYFKTNDEVDGSTKNIKVFTATKKPEIFTKLNISIIIILIAIFFILNTESKKEVPEVIQVDNSAIQTAKKTIFTKESIETNSSVDNNITQALSDDIQESNITHSFKILPKIEVWLGYIDLATHERYQKIFTDELELDPSKDWLLAFGHGHIIVETDNVQNEYTIKKNVRFSYIDSVLKEVTLEEFKALNKGSRW